jgi:glycosyltransferase involved in cell wall biosynthesis
MEPRILLVDNFLSKDGKNPTVAEELAKHFLAEGFIVIRTSNKHSRILRLLDMIFVTWKYRNKYDAAYVSLFSGNAFKWGEIVSVILKFLRKPYILTLHGGRLPIFYTERPNRVRSTLRNATLISTPSKYLLETFRTIRPDIYYLPNGIEICNYPFLLRKHPKPTLIWMRALHNIYLPENAIRVLALLRSEFPDIKLIMIGPDKRDGSLLKLEALSKELRVQDTISWVGQVPKGEVPYYLNQGDIFLNTTTYESFGVTVMEAAACGLPIVTTDVGELSFLWEDKKTAMLVPKSDPEKMAEAVRKVLTEPGLAQQLSQNARLQAEKFDWSKILPEWKKLFLSIIKDHE